MEKEEKTNGMERSKKYTHTYCFCAVVCSKQFDMWHEYSFPNIVMSSEHFMIHNSSACCRRQADEKNANILAGEGDEERE